MPSRKRAREAAKAAADDSAPAPKGAARKKAKRRKKKAKPKTTKIGTTLDPSAADDAETRFVQPYDATKTYICPGCNRDIPPGVGHLVAVPPDDPDLRRHWHRGCWRNRHTRF